MFSMVKNRLYFYIFSILIIILSFAAIFTWKLNLGIDFSGGTIIEISAPGLTNKIEEIKKAGENAGIKFESVSTAGDNKLIARTHNISTEEHNKLLDSIKTVDQNIVETSYQTIGPAVSRDITKKAIWAVVVASIAIIIYIAYAFRKVPKPHSSWHFGLTAVAALIHDLIVTTGFVSIVGHYYSFMQVDALFITALLTIMGFSVHDTIVVFDRLRENMIKNPGNSLETLANDSILQTISRSINTSLTTILILLTLYLLGGQSISHFVLTLIIGITFGTYSSIFIATMLLVSWGNQESKVKS